MTEKVVYVVLDMWNNTDSYEDYRSGTDFVGVFEDADTAMKLITSEEFVFKVANKYRLVNKHVFSINDIKYEQWIGNDVVEYSFKEYFRTFKDRDDGRNWEEYWFSDITEHCFRVVRAHINQVSSEFAEDE